MVTKKQLIIEKSLEILKAYDIKITLRQLYYRLVATQVIENTISQYKRLSAIMVDARKKGHVQHDIFEDRIRSSEIMDDYLYSKVNIWDHYEDWFKEELENYDIPRWHNQKCKVIIVLEKDALSSVLSQICKPLEITLIVNRGYNSYTQLKEIADKLRNIENDLVFLTFGDFDPTGKDIMRNFRVQLGDLGISGEFNEIALNQKQITDYNLPPAPTKKSDSRSKKFIQEFGDRSVELDALDPDTLQQLVKESAGHYFDDEILELNQPIKENYRNYLDARLEKVRW